MTSPYLRAAANRPDLVAEAAIKLAQRQPAPEERIRARNADGTYRADDPSTPENEAWQ